MWTLDFLPETDGTLVSMLRTSPNLPPTELASMLQALCLSILLIQAEQERLQGGERITPNELSDYLYGLLPAAPLN